jgi:hypothetical protein
VDYAVFDYGFVDFFLDFIRYVDKIYFSLGSKLVGFVVNFKVWQIYSLLCCIRKLLLK